MGPREPYGIGIVHAPVPPIWHLIFRITDATLHALGFTQESQRDYPDGTVRGLSIRGGKQTKTFMPLITNGSNRSRVKLCTYPDTSLSRARELHVTGSPRPRIARSDLPSINSRMRSIMRFRGGADARRFAIIASRCAAVPLPQSTQPAPVAELVRRSESSPPEAAPRFGRGQSIGQHYRVPNYTRRVLPTTCRIS